MRKAPLTTITPTMADRERRHSLSWHLKISDQCQGRRNPQEGGKEMRELGHETPGKGGSAEAFDAVGPELDPSSGRVCPRQASRSAAQRRQRVVQWKLVDPWHLFCERAYAQAMPHLPDERCRRRLMA